LLLFTLEEEQGLSVETPKKRRGNEREFITGPCSSASLETTMPSMSAPPAALFDKDKIWESS
jgi:hypothetical protein